MGSLSTSPARGPGPGRRRPQWPWEVNSSRQVSAHTTSASPTSARTAATARLRMPSSAQAPEPVSSRVAGTPNRSMAPTPAAAQAAASRRTESSVCCHWPGMAPMGRGSAMSSRTKTGRMSAAGEIRVWATRPRMAGVVRRRRGRIEGADGAGTPRSARKPAAGEGPPGAAGGVGAADAADGAGTADAVPPPGAAGDAVCSGRSGCSVMVPRCGQWAGMGASRPCASPVEADGDGGRSRRRRRLAAAKGKR